MEFILALILFAYWGIRIAVEDRPKSTPNKNVTNVCPYTRESWERTACRSSSEEQKFREEMMSPSRYAKVRAEALKTVRSFRGLEWATFKAAHPRQYGDAEIRRLVLYIESVKRGYIPRDAIFGSPPPLSEAIDLYIPRSAYVDFGRWTENTIKERIPNARLYALSQHGGYVGMQWEPYAIERKEAILRVNDPDLESRMTGGYPNDVAAEKNEHIANINRIQEETQAAIKKLDEQIALENQQKQSE